MQLKQKSSMITGLFLTVIFISCLLLPELSTAGATIPPAWYQKLSSSKRFSTVLDGTAVLDKETGLVWEKSPSAAIVRWVDAFTVCNHKVSGTRKGWRVPTVDELNSLVDTASSYPSLPAGHPFNIQYSYYWSASSSAENSNYAWFVDFGSGNSGIDIKPNSWLIWCVRGATQ